MRRGIKFGLVGGVSLAALALAAAPAQGQENTDTVVVVRGEKTERTLQDTPTSVAVITAADIEDSAIDNLRDIYQRTANVTGGDFAGEFTIRGIDAQNVSGGGSSALASIYVDGAVLPRRSRERGPLGIWDAAQVEILRGPQSTLQGRNALAGAVIVRTADPTYYWEGRAQARFTDFNGEEYSIAGGGPLVDDQLAFRLAAQTSHFGGFTDNPFLGADSDADDSDLLRAKLLFEPNILPDFSALLTLTYSDARVGDTRSSVESTFDDRVFAYNVPTGSDTLTRIATLELSYDLNDQWSLTSISSYNDSDYLFRSDADLTPADEGESSTKDVAETFTQELRANFDFGRFTGILGAYYFNSESTQQLTGESRLSLEGSLGVRTLLTAPPEFGGLGLDDATADFILNIYAPVDPVQLGVSSNVPLDAMSYALFADARFDLTEQLTIYGGLRYDYEEQEISFEQNVEILNIAALPDPADYASSPLLAAIIGGLNAQLLAQAANASDFIAPSGTDFESVLPKIGASWNWTDDISTSFTVQRGYRTGGVGSNVARASIHTFDAEYTWNYELAFRSTWFDNKLTINSNVFYIDWSDQQVTVQLSDNIFDTETENAGASTLYGAELEVFYRPSANLDVFAGVGYTKTEFDEFIFTSGGEDFDLSGTEFAGAPQWTASAGFSHRSPSGLFLHGDVVYTGDAKATISPTALDANQTLDARTLVNAMVGYEFDKYGAYLFADNLLNEEYIVSGVFNDRLTYGEARVVGVRLNARF